VWPGWPEKLAFIWQTEQRLIRLTDRPAIGIVGMLAAGMHFPARRMRVGTLNA